MREMKDTQNNCLGMIPKDWEYPRLKYYCKISNGSDPQTEGQIPVYGSGKEIVKYCGEYKEGPAILLGRKGTLDKPRYIEGKFWNVDTAMDAYPINGINSKFLYFVATILDIGRYATVTAKPSMTQSDYYNMPIPVPPASEQEQIVRYIEEKTTDIDEAISRQKETIEKLEEYKRATIIYKVSHTDTDTDYVSSGIPWMPEIPKSWDILPLKYAVTQRVNKNVGMQEKNLLTLSYGEIKRKNIETNEGLLPASFEGYNIIEKGDVVLRLLDLQNDTHSLRTGLVRERGIITSAYVTITPSSLFDSAYCRYLLHAYDLMKVLYTMGEGVRQSLSFNELSRKILIAVPPIDEQRKIAEDISTMETNVNEAINRMLKNIEKLEEYKKSLIYNAVTGKIDCRNA